MRLLNFFLYVAFLFHKKAGLAKNNPQWERNLIKIL